MQDQRKGLPQLNDAALLRDQPYLNGAWTGAEASFRVTNPPGGTTAVTVPNMGVQQARLEMKYLCVGGI